MARSGISTSTVFLIGALCLCLGLLLGLFLPRYLPSLNAHVTPGVANPTTRNGDGGKAATEQADSRQGTARPAPVPVPPDGCSLGDAELRHYFDERADSVARAEESFQTKIVGRVGEFSGEVLSVDANGKLRLSLDAYRGSKAAERLGTHEGFLNVQKAPAWLATRLNSGDRISVRAKVLGRGTNAIQSDFVEVIRVNGGVPERPAK